MLGNIFWETQKNKIDLPTFFFSGTPPLPPRGGSVRSNLFRLVCAANSSEASKRRPERSNPEGVGVSRRKEYSYEGSNSGGLEEVRPGKNAHTKEATRVQYEDKLDVWV